MNRYRIAGALDSEHAIVPAEFDTVLGRQTGQEMTAEVDGPQEFGAEGHDPAQQHALSLGAQRRGIVVARGFGERVDGRSVRPEHDDLHDEAFPGQVARAQERAPGRVSDQR